MKISKKKFGLLNELTHQNPLIRDGYHLRIDSDFWGANFRHEATYNTIFTEIKASVLGEKNINYVTKTVSAIYDNDFMVADRLWRLRDEVTPCSGVLLVWSGLHYFYTIMPAKNGKIGVFCFTFEQDLWLAYTSVFWDIGTEYKATQFQTEINFDLSKGIVPNYHVLFPIQTVVTFELFKQYAEIETKIIQSGTTNRKVKINHEKYLSEFPFKVQIIDSKYFTNLIRTNGFKVKGHFRLQPYGEGRKNRRLQWIHEFEKSGYTRKATKLKK